MEYANLNSQIKEKALILGKPSHLNNEYNISITLKRQLHKI